MNYNPEFLSWVKSHDEEVKELRELILGNPADINLLKKEFEYLTGYKFKRKKGE